MNPQLRRHFLDCPAGFILVYLPQMGGADGEQLAQPLHRQILPQMCFEISRNAGSKLLVLLAALLLQLVRHQIVQRLHISHHTLHRLHLQQIRMPQRGNGRLEAQIGVNFIDAAQGRGE
ncbi:hypothetical protein D3C75_1077110 [compost metagenome]